MWMFLARLGLGLLFAAISYALSPRPKSKRPEAAGLDEFDLPTAEEGRPIPVVFGTVRVKAPNVVWAGDLRTKKIKEKGGKK
ncbi:hypothetical protein C2I36_09855 [Rhodobacteraceae bacterium WD3A24]|nr:hypothetical protein C2I36_09855 [Rhodobacteraceae bacterium WD3A24]